MIFDTKKLTAEKFYPLMIQAIIPRPIAWVLSQNPDNTFNVAPFSFFNGITSEPPIIMISVGWKDDTTHKDTWINIEERNDFVLHIPPSTQGKEVGDEQQGLIMGEIKKMWVDDEAISHQNSRIQIDPKKVDPLSRLGGKDYSTLGPIFSIERPK